MVRLPLVFLLLASLALAKEPTAFEFANPDKKVKTKVDLKEIIRGLNVRGDPRDKLPPIYKPVIVSAEASKKFLKDSNRVLGVEVNGEARAYPLFILSVHEMCNDTLGGKPIAPNY